MLDMKNFSKLYIQPDFKDAIEENSPFYLNVEVTPDSIKTINFKKIKEKYVNDENDEIIQDNIDNNLYHLKYQGMEYQFQNGNELELGLTDGDISWTSIDCTDEQIVLGNEDGIIETYLFEDNSYNKKINIFAHDSTITKAQIFPSGSVLLTGSSDMQIKIFSLVDGSNPRIFKGHTRGVTDLAMIDRGRNFLSSSNDGTIKLWECGQGICEQTIKQNKDLINSVNCISLSNNEENIIYGGYKNGDICNFDLRNGKLINNINNDKKDKIDCIGIENGENYYIYGGFSNGIISKWDIRNNKIIEEYKISEILLTMGIINDKLILSSLDSTFLFDKNKICYFIDKEERGSNDFCINKNKLITVGKYNKLTEYQLN